MAETLEIDTAPAADKGGRRVVYKCTPQMVSDICDRVSMGVSVEAALTLSGVPKSSHGNWLKRNVSAADRIAEAEANFENGLLFELREKARSDAKVGQWLLERRNPARWAAVSRQEISGPGGGPVQSLTLSKALLASIAVAPDKPKPVRRPKGVPAHI